MTSHNTTIKLKSLELLRQYQQQPSPHVRNRIVELNMGLVRQEAHYWKKICHESFDDLMQIGSIGLIQAVERFQLDRGITLGAFSKPYIRGSIQHFLRDRGHTVRIPRSLQVLIHQRRRVTNDLNTQLQRSPRADEIRQAMNISLAEWQQMELADRNHSALSLDAPIGHENQLPLGDTILDSSYQSFQLAEEERLCLIQEMSQLERRTRAILECMYVHGLTYKETARQLNTSIGTVYRHVRKGLHQLAKQRDSLAAAS